MLPPLLINNYSMAFHNRKYEMGLATASFIVAVILAFLGMALHKDHDIAAGVCMVIAQFLILTASIIGIDYKLNSFGSTRPKGVGPDQIEA